MEKKSRNILIIIAFLITYFIIEGIFYYQYSQCYIPGTYGCPVELLTGVLILYGIGAPVLFYLLWNPEKSEKSLIVFVIISITIFGVVSYNVINQESDYPFTSFIDCRVYSNNVTNSRITWELYAIQHGRTPFLQWSNCGWALRNESEHNVTGANIEFVKKDNSTSYLEPGDKIVVTAPNNGDYKFVIYNKSSNSILFESEVEYY